MVSATIDQYGIDPLRDEEFEVVGDSQYKEVTIDSSMEGNPQLLSFRQYGTNKYWRMILIANGLKHSSELKAGRVKVPIASVNKKAKKPKVETRL